MTNLEIARQLRNVAAAYQILNENRFKIIAYERAADSIEHLTSEVKDLWDDGKLSEVPGIGSAIADHLDELFKTGKVRHWEAVLKRVPEAVFPLLSVPGLGPKKAYKLVSILKLKTAKTVIADLEKAAQEGKIAPIEGFGEKSQEVILDGITAFKKGQIKAVRMPLPLADAIGQEVMAHLLRHPAVRRADALGSLRRQVATVGDVDIAAATNKPREVVDHFLSFPHRKIVEQGLSGATLILNNGRQVDLRVQKPEAYGAMLQYFTGGKNHNIKLREFALEKGLSLSEYGIKSLRANSKFKIQNAKFFNKEKKIYEFATEEDFYKALGLVYIPPELREDKGEIEVALRDELPKLVELKDIRADLHVHTSYDLEPSHDLGTDPLDVCLDQALALGYEYVGLSDHNPSVSRHTSAQIVDIMKRRKEKYEQQYSSWTQKVSKTKRLNSQKLPKIFIMLEVDILTDGQLALPSDAFESVDAVIASIHSAFTQERKIITDRILSGLTAHPKVRFLGHPTGRMLGSREGVNADWPEIFEVCRKRDIALEINAYPDRLDLPDALVFDARKIGLKFCINTDAHAAEQMGLMRYGVSVARRGWAEKNDIVNTLGYNEFKKWLMKS